MVGEIQLEISINIGEKTYKLEVPRQSNLSEIVHVFLKAKHLNPKYHQQILQLIKRELENRNQPSALDQIRKAKEQIERKKQIQMFQYRTTQNNTQHNNQNLYQTLNMDNTPSKKVKEAKETNKNKILNKIQNVIESSQHETPECQIVYEQWKNKEKQKNNSKSIQKVNKTVSRPSTSPLAKQINIQAHEPSYFYNRGLAFNKVKQNHNKTKFKECYPFTTRKDMNITSKEKNYLHQKLYTQSKIKKIEKIKTQINQLGERDKSFTKINNKDNPFKEKIAKRRNQIDIALAQLLEEGKLSKATQIKVVSKSPFRKTKVY